MTRDTSASDTEGRLAVGGPGRPRRELLTGAAAAALGAVVGETLASATPAQAIQGQPVILGQDNTGATAITSLSTTTGQQADLADPVNSVGVAGSASNFGVTGTASNGIGVFGSSNATSGAGVVGNCNSGPGVIGNGATVSGSGPGVSGKGGGSGPGVIGTGAGNGDGVAGTGGTGNGTGVFGGGGGTTGIGVVGLGAGFLSGGNGIGVSGLGTGTGDGVLGRASAGNGVHGQATAASGAGVLAENIGGGPALHATGPALFSRSGTVVIPSGMTKATVTPPGGLSSSALVLALMQNVAPGVMVMAAVPSPGTGTVQIVLNKAPKSPATATVAWFVVN